MFSRNKLSEEEIKSTNNYDPGMNILTDQNHVVATTEDQIRIANTKSNQKTLYFRDIATQFESSYILENNSDVKNLREIWPSCFSPNNKQIQTDFVISDPESKDKKRKETVTNTHSSNCEMLPNLNGKSKTDGNHFDVPSLCKNDIPTQTDFVISDSESKDKKRKETVTNTHLNNCEMLPNSSAKSKTDGNHFDVPSSHKNDILTQTDFVISDSESKDKKRKETVTNTHLNNCEMLPNSSAKSKTDDNHFDVPSSRKNDIPTQTDFVISDSESKDKKRKETVTNTHSNNCEMLPNSSAKSKTEGNHFDVPSSRKKDIPHNLKGK